MKSVQSERDANDLMRRYMRGGKIVLKGCIAVRSDLVEILRKVRTSKIDPATNWFDQHNFGSFEHSGEWFCWEIEEELSLEDNQFYRVLTIMLADQY